MLIKEIIVDGFDLSPDADRQSTSGQVALVGDTDCIRVQCNVPTYLSACQTSLRRRLVNEAVRQARRLPEYRSGRGSLSFAPALMAAGLLDA